MTGSSEVHGTENAGARIFVPSNPGTAAKPSGAGGGTQVACVPSYISRFGKISALNSAPIRTTIETRYSHTSRAITAAKEP